MDRFRIRVAAAWLFAAVGFVSATSAHAASCDITFRIGTNTPLSTASVFVIYQNAPGEFDGSTTGVQCTLLNNTLGQASDADQTRTLSLTAIGTPTPIQGPKDFARCKWTPSSRLPVAGDFNLSGQSGFNTSLPFPAPVNANITISEISCSGTVSTTTTTTTTTTSTTIPVPDCGDFDNNGKIQTSDALNVLKVAVGQKVCQLCVCDVDKNGKISTVDALTTLKAAVGTIQGLVCAACS